MDDLGFEVLPNERRHFVHKRLLGAAKGFVTSGFNPLSAVGGFLRSPAPPPVRRPAPRSTVARPSRASASQKDAGRSAKFANLARLPGVNGQAFRGTDLVPTCSPPRFRIGNRCVDPRAVLPGGIPFTTAFEDPAEMMGATAVGGAVMGRFGAGLTPGSRIIDRAVCLRGMVLGEDGICYNRTQIKNSERMWPRGRRPLLTGGDMRAISIASRAASRLTRTAVRLQEIGLIKKPVARKPRKSKHS